eukprot:m.87396 g.87396  ORF g.87396 m.87396 type:complete len:114 (-) comp12828_c0_seq1:193-534(-)
MRLLLVSVRSLHLISASFLLLMQRLHCLSSDFEPLSLLSYLPPPLYVCIFIFPFTDLTKLQFLVALIHIDVGTAYHLVCLEFLLKKICFYWLHATTSSLNRLAFRVTVSYMFA